MSVSKLPIWAAVLVLSGATFAYGQATQVPAPGGVVPPAIQQVPPVNPAPGPSPQTATGHDATVPAPGGQLPPVATPTPSPDPAPGPSPQGAKPTPSGTTGH